MSEVSENNKQGRDFVHLHLHTEYSLLDGACRIRELPKVVKPAPMDMGRVKARYLSELADIAGQYDQGKLDIRGAYQRMSRCIRGFVHAATGIRVQNYTLYDIERLNMPELYYLVAEYYAPEFARKSDGDVRASLEKARSLIERWQ